LTSGLPGISAREDSVNRESNNAIATSEADAMMKRREFIAQSAARRHGRQRHRMRKLIDWRLSAAELADMEAEPVFDVTGAMEAALHQRLDPVPGGRAAATSPTCAPT
jgi:hypothetical protein